jgi:hypothetical protein
LGEQQNQSEHARGSCRRVHVPAHGSLLIGPLKGRRPVRFTVPGSRFPVLEFVVDSRLEHPSTAEPGTENRKP